MTCRAVEAFDPPIGLDTVTPTAEIFSKDVWLGLCSEELTAVLDEVQEVAAVAVAAALVDAISRGDGVSGDVAVRSRAVPARVAKKTINRGICMRLLFAGLIQIGMRTC